MTTDFASSTAAGRPDYDSAVQAARIPSAVLERVRAVVGAGPVPLHEPLFRGREKQYVADCIDSTFVSSVGRYVDKFEAELAGFTGARHAVAVVNGTAALQIALKLAGVEADDEVLVPALTFVATANAVSYCGGIPHFVDSSEDRLGLDPVALKEYLRTTAMRRGDACVNRVTGRRIRAVVPMHAFGHPVDMDPLLEIAAELGIVVVEDAAESLGSSYNGRHTGTMGMLGTLSFNGNKTITTGGGGAIITDDSALARRAKHLTTTAKMPHKWEYRHDEIGYNYRMPNINAALGCAQLEQLPALLAAKRKLYERYERAFADMSEARIVAEPRGCVSNYWLQTLVLSEGAAQYRDEVLETNNAAGFGSRPVWTLMHRLTAFHDSPRMELTAAESLERRVVNLPSSAQLAMQDLH